MRIDLAYAFDDVCVDRAAMRVTKAGLPVTLEPKVFDVLLHLLDNRGVLVGKAQLLEVVWPGTFVTENNVAHAVSQLRRTLGDSAKCARYIETVPRRGYRFIAPVVEQPSAIFPGLNAESTVRGSQAPQQAGPPTSADPLMRDTLDRLHAFGPLAARSWRAWPLAAAALMSLCAVLAAGAALLSGSRGALLSTNRPAGSVNAANSGKDQLTREAYELCLRGQFNRQLRSVAAIDRSVEYFERALAIDPGSAPALAGLAGARFEQDILNGEFGASRAEVKRLAARAIDEDAALAEAYVEQGRVFGYYDWDWDRAEAAFKRAIQLKPSLALAYSEYSFLLQAQARIEEAVVQARKATAVDPRLPLALSDEGRALYRARRFSEAEGRYLRALELDPGFMFTFERLFDLYVAQRRFAEARQILTRLEQSPPRRVPMRFGVLLEAATGQPGPTWRSMTGVSGRTRTRQLVLDARASVARGDRDRALAQLEQAVTERRILPFRWTDPELDPLRTDPRFARLVHRMALPVESLVALGR
jgi:DNA-binding winged helix-turn-helix (wHTH) protein/tetratricopeptide (TPR) repeat protein